MVGWPHKFCEWFYTDYEINENHITWIRSIFLENICKNYANLLLLTMKSCIMIKFCLFSISDNKGLPNNKFWVVAWYEILLIIFCRIKRYNGQYNKKCSEDSICLQIQYGSSTRFFLNKCSFNPLLSVLILVCRIWPILLPL